MTGADDVLGRALVERLAAHPSGLAVVPVEADVSDPGLAASLEGVETVVHLASSVDASAVLLARQAVDVRGTAALLAAARAARVRRVVLVSSTDVYGSHPDADLPLPESAALLAPPDDTRVGDLVEVERLADHALRTGLDVVVLRPAALTGAGLDPALGGALLQSLSGSRLLAVRGVEPLWQLCHVDDLLSALELAALGGVSGAAVVAADGWLTQREVEQLTGRRRLELPAAVALSTAERLHRIGATPGSPRELDRLLHPVVLDTARLRAAGWAPAWTAADTLTAHLRARPAPTVRAGVPAPGAAAGATAAGATVALLGTAALVRRARARRGR